MRLYRNNNVTNGLVIGLAILTIALSSVVKCEEAKKKEDEYDYKPPGYPGSDTNKGMKYTEMQK